MEGEKKEGVIDLADLKKQMLGKSIVKVKTFLNINHLVQ